MRQDRADLLVQTALWYYEDGLDQSEIAARLGKSRSMVSRMLSEARTSGIIKIKIKVPIRRSAETESLIRNAFGLDDVWILDEPPGLTSRRSRLVSELAGMVLQRHLTDGVRVGLAWSRTLYDVVAAFPFMQLNDATVVQLSGSIAVDDPRLDGPEIVRSFANKINADFRYLMAPLIVKNPYVRETLMSEQAIAETLRQAGEVNVAIVGIGSIRSANSTLRDSDLVEPATVNRLLDAGVVGDIIGQQYTVEGRELKDEINNRVVGITLSELSKIETVIAVATGNEKAPAIAGGLRGGWFNCLVTDLETASAVLKLTDRSDT